MASHLSNDLSDAPTIFCSPARHPWSNTPHQQPSQSSNHNLSYLLHRKPLVLPSRSILEPRQSRKRAREDDDDEPSEHNSCFDLTPTTVLDHRVAIYGEGMTLSDPVTGSTTLSESQTGTWYEEHLETERQASMKAALVLLPETKPKMARSAKCSRFDDTSSQCSDHAAQTIDPVNDRTRSQTNPVIDDATLRLGVGWSVISHDADAQAAARGWARYIENHYPRLTNVQILLRSAGLDSYLVEASDGLDRVKGFFLFADDLLEGQMVAREWNACIANLLHARGTVFEGGQVLTAIQTPRWDSDATEQLYKTASLRSPSRSESFSSCGTASSLVGFAAESSVSDVTSGRIDALNVEPANDNMMID